MLLYESVLEENFIKFLTNDYIIFLLTSFVLNGFNGFIKGKLPRGIMFINHTYIRCCKILDIILLKKELITKTLILFYTSTSILIFYSLDAMINIKKTA